MERDSAAFAKPLPSSLLSSPETISLAKASVDSFNFDEYIILKMKSVLICPYSKLLNQSNRLEFLPGLIYRNSYQIAICCGGFYWKKLVDYSQLSNREYTHFIFGKTLRYG